MTKPAKKILLFGAGSSATRFANIFLQKGFEVYTYVHRPDVKIPPNTKPITVLENPQQFTLAVIATTTATHAHYLRYCVQHDLPVLVDKPIAQASLEVRSIIQVARKKHSLIMVGFNLRMLPIIEEISHRINQKKLGRILHANLYVGQYLPDWRPHKDYRQTYSASYQAGGGVALDLIHEIDLALHWFPSARLSIAHASKLSNLDINVEDYVELKTNQLPFITVKLDYLNHNKTRRYEIVGERGSISCDIFGQISQFRSLDEEILFSDPALFDLPQTYQSEIDHFLIKLKKQDHQLDDRALGLDALKIAEQARVQISN